MQNILPSIVIKHTLPRKRLSDIVTIVVTYNRKEMLVKCLEALLNQTVETDVLIIDNASTDHTESKLIATGLSNAKGVHYVKLNWNTGGAGGFHYGLKIALEKGWKWFWLMDDDAVPHQNALKTISFYADDENAIYGSAAVNTWGGDLKLCFPAKERNSKHFIEDHRDLKAKEPVEWLPFLGFFVHRNLISKIGLPDKYFFILDDDVEFSERAKRNGAEIYLIRESVISHPYQPKTMIALPGIKVYYRSMPPWKVYYDTRNKIIISRRYYHWRLWTQTMPGILLRILLSMMIEKSKKEHIRAYLAAIISGFK